MLAAGLAERQSWRWSAARDEHRHLRVTTLSADAFASRLAEAGVRMLTRSPDTLRAVTHLNVSAAQIKEAVELMRRVVAAPQ